MSCYEGKISDIFNNELHKIAHFLSLIISKNYIDTYDYIFTRIKDIYKLIIYSVRASGIDIRNTSTLIYINFKDSQMDILCKKILIELLKNLNFFKSIEVNRNSLNIKHFLVFSIEKNEDISEEFMTSNGDNKDFYIQNKIDRISENVTPDYSNILLEIYSMHLYNNGVIPELSKDSELKPFLIKRCIDIYQEIPIGCNEKITFLLDYFMRIINNLIFYIESFILPYGGIKTKITKNDRKEFLIIYR